MSFPKLTGTLNKLAKSVRRNSPTILLVSGLASGCASLYFAVKATVKSVREIDAEEEQLPGKEIIKRVWKNYIPTAVTAGGAAACFIGMHSIHQKRTATLLMAYKASEATLLQYHDKVIDTLGEKKEKEIQEKVVEQHVAENPPTLGNIIVIDYDGEIIYDEPNKRYYKISMAKVFKAFMEINKELLLDSVKLNRYYELIGLEEMDIGDIYVWEPTADGLEVQPVGCTRAYSDIGKSAFMLSIWPPYSLDTSAFD